MIYSYGNKQLTTDGPNQVTDPAGYPAALGWWTHLKLDSTADWLTNDRPYDSLEGIRPHRVMQQDGTEVINGSDHPTRPNRDARIYIEQIAHRAIFGVNLEPMPASRWGTDAELVALDTYGQGLIDHIQQISPTALIGGYWPWFDWSLAAERHHGTISDEDDTRERWWWGRLKRSLKTGMSFFDRLHVLMTPFYGYGDLDPRWWVPELVQRLNETHKPIMPHLWAYHKNREMPGKPNVLRSEADNHYVCESIAEAGHKDVMLWLTGSTDQDYEAQLPFIKTVQQYFGGAA